jgi:hypothetical protein
MFVGKCLVPNVEHVEHKDADDWLSVVETWQFQEKEVDIGIEKHGRSALQMTCSS